MLFDRPFNVFYAIEFYIKEKVVERAIFKNYLNAVMAYKEIERENYKLGAYDYIKLIQIKEIETCKVKNAKIPKSF